MAEPQVIMADDFSGYGPGPVQGRWQPVGERTEWRISELDRPRENREVWPIVESPTMHVAFPVMARCPRTGRLYVVYRHGYTHAPNLAPRDGAIMMLTSDDGGHTWSNPRCIFDDPNYDDRNAAVSVMSDGTVVVCWDQYLKRWHHRALYMVSGDGGETWSEPRRLGRTENLTCRSRAIELSNGLWLFPIYSHYGPGPLGSFALLMDPATGEQQQVLIPNEPEELAGGDEVTVCEVAEGRVLALIRSQEVPYLIASWSEDYGQTWSARQRTEIPSQFAPCDLIKLPDGRLACSFSFRERRNERLVISHDGGLTWDVENSLDIFDATVGIGDRSYVSSAVIDENTVGHVLYETEAYPRGGRIWFARTDLRAYGATRCKCLHHTGLSAGDGVATGLDGGECTAMILYRFTGRFAEGTQGGIELRLAGKAGKASFSYWMGIGPDRGWDSTNRWELELSWGAQRDTIRGSCTGDSFNDGNEHALVLSYRSGRVTAAIDDYQQVERAWPGLEPARLEIAAHSATVAVYKVEVWR